MTARGVALAVTPQTSLLTEEAAASSTWGMSWCLSPRKPPSAWRAGVSQREASRARLLPRLHWLGARGRPFRP